jgi:hypothetical protein
MLKPFDVLHQRLPLKMLLFASTTAAAPSTSASGGTSTGLSSNPGQAVCRLFPAEIQLLVDSDERSRLATTLSRRLEALHQASKSHDGPCPGLWFSELAALEGLDVLRLSNISSLADSLHPPDNPLQQQQQQQRRGSEFVLQLQIEGAERGQKKAKKSAKQDISRYQATLQWVSQCA